MKQVHEANQQSTMMDESYDNKTKNIGTSIVVMPDNAVIVLLIAEFYSSSFVMECHGKRRGSVVFVGRLLQKPTLSLLGPLRRTVDINAEEGKCTTTLNKWMSKTQSTQTTTTKIEYDRTRLRECWWSMDNVLSALSLFVHDHMTSMTRTMT
jgi:hypothetical protein